MKKLYFKDNEGNLTFVQEIESENNYASAIRDFLGNKYIHYFRSWLEEDGSQVIDFGSWSEFFIIK